MSTLLLVYLPFCYVCVVEGGKDVRGGLEVSGRRRRGRALAMTPITIANICLEVHLI